jgi:2-polyprenyl-3-methyl-5-hydroxy-6-metoxy-1,4-benzoquinol methylase
MIKKLIASTKHVERPCPCCHQINSEVHREVKAEEFFQKRCSIFDATTVFCNKCGLEYTNPVLIPELDELQYYELEGYISPFPAEADLLIREDDRVTFCEIDGHFKNSIKDKKILDFGAGRGGFVRLCQNYGVEAHGLELNKDTVASASALGIENMRTNYIQDEPSNSYDVVTSIHVLEHMTDCLSMLHEFHRVLKPGGIAVVIMPNYESVRFRLQPDKYWNMPYQHMNAMSAPALKHSLRMAGLEPQPLAISSTNPVLSVGLRKSISVALTRALANTLNFYPTKLLMVGKK